MCWATPPLRPANAPKLEEMEHTQRLRRGGLGALEVRWKRPARVLNPGTGGLPCLAAAERVGAKRRLSRRLPDFIALLLWRAFGSKSILAGMASVVLPFGVERSNYQRKWALLPGRTSRSVAVRPRNGWSMSKLRIYAVLQVLAIRYDYKESGPRCIVDVIDYSMYI